MKNTPEKMSGKIGILAGLAALAFRGNRSGNGPAHIAKNPELAPPRKARRGRKGDGYDAFYMERAEAKRIRRAGSRLLQVEAARRGMAARR